MQSPSKVVGAAVLVLVAAWLWAAWPSDPSTVEAGRTDLPVPTSSQAILIEMAPALTVAEAVRVLAASGAPVPSAAKEDQAWRGRVVDLRSGAGVPKCQVVVEVPPEGQEAAEGDGRIEAVTDGEGHFLLRSPLVVLPKVVVHAVVLDEVQSPIFMGHIMLVDDLTILVEPARLLRGRITDAASLCGEQVGFALLQERKVAGARTAALGRGTLNADGTFESRARVAWPDQPIAIKVGCGDQMFVLYSDADTLTSDAGFVGTLGLGLTSVLVTDEAGGPVPGASVVASPRMAASNGAFVRRSTDDRGFVQIPVPKDGLEVAVAAHGFRIETTFVVGAPCPASVPVRLTRLGSSDFFQGTVTDAAGMPVEKAVVTALPGATSAAVRVLRPMQARTDAHGQFRITAGVRGVPFAVTAFHKKHGLSVERQVVPNGQDVQLVVPGVRRLRIHAVAPNADSRSRGGDVQWFLTPTTGAVGHGGSGALPIETEPVAAGDYTLVVLWEDMDLYGQARVSVAPEFNAQPDELVVFLEPAMWFEGTLVGARPGLQIRHEHPNWIPEVVTAWGTVMPASNGRFRVLAGNRSAGQLQVVDRDSGVVATAEAVWGSPLTISVPQAKR